MNKHSLQSQEKSQKNMKKTHIVSHFIILAVLLVLMFVAYFYGDTDMSTTLLTTTNTNSQYSDFSEYHDEDPVGLTNDGGLITIGSLYGNEYYSTNSSQITTTIPQTTEPNDFIMHYELVKLNEEGTISWHHDYQTNSFSVDFVYIGQDSNGNYMTIGTKTMDEDNVPYMVKFNQDGQLLSEKAINIPNTSLRKVIHLNDDTYLLVGKTSNEASIIKMNHNGNVLWNDSYGNQESVLNNVVETQNHDLIAVGYDKKANNDACNNHFMGYILKVNNDGNKVWEDSGYCSVMFETIQPVNSNQYLISGINYNENTRLSHMMSLTISDDNTIIKSFQQEKKDDILYQFNPNELFTIEHYTSNNEILKKYDTNQNLIWEVNFNNPDIMTIKSMVEDKEGNVYLFFEKSKRISSTKLISVITLYKVDKNGHIVYQHEIGIT